MKKVSVRFTSELNEERERYGTSLAVLNIWSLIAHIEFGISRLAHRQFGLLLPETMQNAGDMIHTLERKLLGNTVRRLTAEVDVQRTAPGRVTGYLLTLRFFDESGLDALKAERRVLSLLVRFNTSGYYVTFAETGT